GQVCFPGGSIEDYDASPLIAALRETGEEVGVLPEQVDVLGQLDDVVTNSALFRITPFVGLIPDGAAHITSDGEVARILEVPLEHLLDPRKRQPDPLTGHWRYEWEGAVIWGATARMLSQLLEVLGLTSAPVGGR